MKIKIKKSTDADSRTAEGELSEAKLKIASIQHRKEVGHGMTYLANKIYEVGKRHDWTKIAYFNMFWNDYKQGLTGEEFKKAPWYQIHITEERHHLNSNCPDDVNLLDVLELIVDCIMAGKGRCGKVDMKFFELPDGLLEKAYYNTVELVDNVVELEEE